MEQDWRTRTIGLVDLFGSEKKFWLSFKGDSCARRVLAAKIFVLSHQLRAEIWKKITDAVHLHHL